MKFVGYTFPGFRRMISAVLTVVVVFVAVRLIFKSPITWMDFYLLLVSAGLSAIFTKFFHKIIVKPGEENEFGT